MSNPQPITIKHSLVYIILLVICGAGVWFVLKRGSALDQKREAPVNTVSRASSPEGSPPGEISVARLLSANLRNALSILLLQLVVIVIASRLVGKLFLMMGQPRVMGEIVAGIILGPSLLGQLSPNTMAFVFPAESLEPLRLLSQIGVVLFMFIVGMELELGELGWANEFQLMAKLIGRRFSSFGRTRTTTVDQLLDGPGASTIEPSAMFSSFMKSTRHGKPLRFPVT